MRVSPEDFSWSVVRMPTPVGGSIVRAAKQALRQVQSVLDQGEIFCHFESRDNELLCCFSLTRGYLPGECVRHSLEATRNVENFLYVEKLIDDYALVYVRNGVVAKEGRMHSIAINSDLQQLCRQLHEQNEPYRFFLYGEDPEHFSSIGDVSIETLDKPLLCRDNPPPSLPALDEQRRALRKLAPGVLWLRVSIVTAIMLLIAGLYLFFTWPEDLELKAIVEAEVGLDLRSQLGAALSQPGARQTLPAIHRNYYLALTDDVFGQRWRVDALEYAGEEQALTLSMTLPQMRGAPLELFPEQELEAMRQRLYDHVQGLGWTISEFDNFNWKQTRNLDLAPRDGEQVARAAQGMDARWERERLDADLGQLGPLELVDIEDNRVYRVLEGNLELADDNWLASWVTGELAVWLGDYFQDIPLVIDSLRLDTRLAGANALAGVGRQGSITWRIFSYHSYVDQ